MGRAELNEDTIISFYSYAMIYFEKTQLRLRPGSPRPVVVNPFGDLDFPAGF